MAQSNNQNPPPDVAEMFQLAEQYSVASNLLSRQSRGKKRWSGAPYLLVDSFAIELYLKCLITQDTGKAPDNGHDFRKLFDAIDPLIQTQVREAFQRVIKADVMLSLSPTIHRAIDPDPVVLKVLNFDQSLDAASNTFAGRRYLYESRPQAEWYYAHLLRLAVRNVAMTGLKVIPFIDSQAGEPPHSDSAWSVWAETIGATADESRSADRKNENEQPHEER